MEKYAPVLIPTLCRYEKLKVLIQSLSQNSYAQNTELIIGLDYPPSDKYIVGHRLIKDYLPTIKGFGKVTVIEHQVNLGAIRNENFLIEFACSKGYDRYIFTEDDNEFSPNFLEYINKGLEKYEHCKRVVSISGYNYPINMGAYDKNIYASYKYSGWGCGQWMNRTLHLSRRGLLKFIINPIHFFKILYYCPGKFLILPVMLLKKDIYGDSCYEIYSCVNNWVSIFPTLSKVRNWGRDGSGLHGQTDETDPCYNQEIDAATTFEYDEMELENMRIKELDRYFSRIIRKAVKRNLKKFFPKSSQPSL